MKVIEQNKSGSIGIILPKELRKDYGWEPGTELDYAKDLKNQTIIIFKRKVIG